MNELSKAQEIEMQLANCTPSENTHQHPLYKGINYSDGIKIMYEICYAHWLVMDLLANCKVLSRHQEFICIQLFKKEDETNCTVFYDDGNDKILWGQEYANIDFPLFDRKKLIDGDVEVTIPAIKFYFKDNILKLPSES